MEKPPSSIRRHVDLVGIGFGVSNELGCCLRWNRWIDHHEKRDANNASNWRDVVEKKEIKIVVQRRVDRRRSVNHEERVAVWADFTTASVAMLVPAPGRFSTTNGWPRRSESCWPIRRRDNVRMQDLASITGQGGQAALLWCVYS